MKNPISSRKLRLESLEDRCLLAVAAGGIEMAAELATPTGSSAWIVNTLDDPPNWNTFDSILSLREAIGRAQTGDTITFNAVLTGGTITLSGSQLEIGQGVTIDASSIGGMTIDADGRSRVFYVSGGNETNPAELICLMVTGGWEDSGGGIYNDGTLMIANSTVEGNNASWGGGIYNYGTLILTGSTVAGNSADYDAGGIYNDENSTVTVTDSAVSGNTANWGGGIDNYGTVTFTNSTVSGNTAHECGGGIYNDEYGTLTLTGSTVAGNSAYGGGGIDDYCGILTLTNTIVSLNYALFDSNISHASPFGGSNNIIGLDPGFAVAPVFEDGVLVNADELDLSLTAESIAIDAGTNTAADTETDFAGNPRIVAAWRKIATVDIGAFEYQGKVTRGAIEMPSTVVTTLLDIADETDGLISLREAISYAAAGDTITFDPALASRRIVLAGAELTIDRNLSIDASAACGITIDADGKSRVFYIAGGDEINPVELIGLTITGGCTEFGGGIYNGGTVKLTGSSVSRNTADYGGGIYNDGTVTFTDSAVAENAANYSGSGICNHNGTVTLMNSTIAGNTANYGGGGIYNSDFCTVTLTGSAVLGNTANDGGGIYNCYGVLTLTNSAVSGNTSKYSGGGIDNFGILTLTNCAVTGNSTGRSGGGIDNGYEGTATVTNCTIADNMADISGSGIYQTGSSTVLTLRNSIIVNNTIDKDIGEINGYNVLSLFTGWNSDSFCIQYNSSLPLFTDAANGNYALAENSQAIDKGNNKYIAGHNTDLAGNPRIVNGIVDLGAYEYRSEQVAAPTILTGIRGIYASYSANRHQITWSTVSHASGYELAYSADRIHWTSVSVSETSAVVTGLTYGADVQYRVRALGTGSYADSNWSAVKTFKVCPMDIDGDEDITGGDRVLMVSAWLSEEGNDKYRYYCDINGDGDITGADRVFLSNNWLLNVEDDTDDLVYPPAKVSDAVFAEYESADLDIDLDIF